jgi:hypothetical protein
MDFCVDSLRLLTNPEGNNRASATIGRRAQYWSAGG